MKNKTGIRILLTAQSLLIIAAVVMLGVSALRICRTGIAGKKENRLSPVYTREKAVDALETAAPVFLLAAGMTAVCTVLKIRDENGNRPVPGERSAVIKAEHTGGMPVRNGNVLRTVLLVCAVAFILIGICNGSMTAVVNKAIRICTECIGLG